MIHTSRSKIVSSFACPRYRYLKYHYGGEGLQRVGQKAPTLGGLAIHQGNALVMQRGYAHRDEIISNVIATYSEEFAVHFRGVPHASDILLEQTHLIEGAIRAFARVRLPQLQFLGTVRHIEKEQQVELGRTLGGVPILYDFRADVIIETPDEMIIVVDFKPSPFGGYQWVRQWERNHQVLAYVWAAQQLSDLPVFGVQIEGYVRGKRKFDEKFGRKIQQTPLCYVYENEVSRVLSPEYQKAGNWTKIPLWDTNLSSKEYIEEFLTAGQVESLFLSPVPPICPTPHQIARWKRQTLPQEVRIEHEAYKVEYARVYLSREEYECEADRAFPMNQDNCYKYGEDYPCEFDSICYNREVEANPLASGLYEERVDHHGEEE